MEHKEKREYSDEFKLKVVEEYFNGPLGCRNLAKKYNLPSKNYIFTWRDQLVKKGLFETQTIKKDYTKVQKNKTKKITKTAYEKQLEKENFELRAKVAFYEELEKLINEDSKKK